MNSISGGGVKKAYEEVGKDYICGKKRVVYKRVKGKPTTKLYMKYKGKFCQVKKFKEMMIASGKWKTTAKKSPKPCKSGKVRNPLTGRCIKKKSPKSPKKKGRPRKKSARHSNRQGSY